MHPFFDTTQTSLKVCGVTLASDAEQLIAMQVPALGVNFWPQSKRYITPERASEFLQPCKNKILRVGVFVNAEPNHVMQLMEQDLIDVAQFHGDESPAYCTPFADAHIPFIRALGVKHADSISHVHQYRANAILLDAYAPEVYGGTGHTFDWSLASDLIQNNPDLPILLAGGITPKNAAEAIHCTHPAALDVASGSESAPGIKDFSKIQQLQDAIASTCSK